MKKHATYIQQKQLNAKKRIIDRIVNAVNNQKMFTAIFTAKFWGVDAFKSHIYESEDYTYEFYSTDCRLNIWYNDYNYMFVLNDNVYITNEISYDLQDYKYYFSNKDCSSFTEDMLCGTIKNKEAFSKAVLLYYAYMGI